MGCLSGCLVSSASIQKLFCGSHSAFKWSLDEFVGEKVVSLSYSSTILGPPSKVHLFSPTKIEYYLPPALYLGFVFQPNKIKLSKIFVVKSLSNVQLFVTPWTADCQASLSFTISPSLLKLMSIELVMPSNHLILCLLLLSSCSQSFQASGSFPVSWLFASGGQSIWNFNFSIVPSNEYSGLISFRIDCLDLLAVQGTLKSLL